MAHLKAAVIGAGPRGRTHLDALSSFDDVLLAAICDPNQETLQETFREYSPLAKYKEVEDLLNNEQLDAIFVAVPAHLNAPIARVCLENGVNTLLEKPPGMNATQAIELRDVAASSGAIGMVGWNRRFNPLIMEARAIVESKGPIQQIVGEFHKSMSRRRLEPVVMDNILYETPIHSIDLISSLSDSPTLQVHSVVRRALSQYKDVHAALIEFENGCVAQLTANFTTGARLERYEIHGRDVSAYLEGVNCGHVMVDGTRVDLDFTGSNGTKEQARHFLDTVRCGTALQPPAADLDEAVKTMRLADAIMAGLKGE